MCALAMIRGQCRYVATMHRNVMRKMTLRKEQCQEILDGVVAIVGEEIVLRSEIVQGAQAFALRVKLLTCSANLPRF